MNIKNYFIIIFIYFYSFFVFSDTGAYLNGKNGFVMPLKNNQITMSDEKIIINVNNIGCSYYELKYDCEFTLENDSNLDQSLLIGFPIDYSKSMDKEGLWIYLKRKTLYSFSVKINNNPIDYQIFLQGTNPELDQIPQYDEVYAFNVNFKKNEKKIIYLSYIIIEPILGHGGYKSGYIDIDYILKSALTWDKPIKNGKIIINFNFPLSSIIKDSEKIFGLEYIPLDDTINEYENLTSVIFEINNLKPTFDIHISCFFNYEEMKNNYYNKEIEKIWNNIDKFNDINNLNKFYILLLYFNRNYSNITEEVKSTIIDKINNYLYNKIQSEDTHIFELSTILYQMIKDEENKYYNNEEIINKLNLSIEKKYNTLAKEYMDKIISLNKLFNNKIYDTSYLNAAVILASIIEINKENSIIYPIKKPIINDNKLIEESSKILKEYLIKLMDNNFIILMDYMKNNDRSINDQSNLLKYFIEYEPLLFGGYYCDFTDFSQNLLIKYFTEYNKKNNNLMAQKLEAFVNFMNGSFNLFWGYIRYSNYNHIIMPGIIKNHHLMKNVYYTLGNYYYSINIDKAKNYYKLALDNYNYSKAKDSNIFLENRYSGKKYEGEDFAPIYYIFYNLCCTYIKKDDINTAFDYLKKAVDEQYPNKDWLLKDPDIKILREKYAERFNKIINKTDN